MAEKKENNAISNITRKISAGGAQALAKVKSFFQEMPKPTRIFVLVLLVAVVAEIPIFLAIGMGARGQAPVLQGFSPSPSLSIAEGEIATFTVTPVDPDGSALSYAWTIDGQQVAASGSSYTFITDTRFGGKVYRVEVTISDGTHQLKQAWSLTVTNVLTRLGTMSFEDDSDYVINDDVMYFAGGYDNGAGSYWPYGCELWRSDGTAAGTYMSGDLRPGNSGSDPEDFAMLNGEIYCSLTNTTGDHLYKTNGTVEGTTLVKVINPSSFASITQMTAGEHWLYFTANNGVNGSEIWKSNGTAAGTMMIVDLIPGPGDGNAGGLTTIGDTLYFVKNQEMWISNGTAAGTAMLKNFSAGGSDPPSMLGILGNTLFFVANDGINGSEVWKTNGTQAGTVMLKEINAGAAGIDFDNEGSAAIVGNTLYFTANDTTHGCELWKTDGTETGTILVKDINTADSSTPLCLGLVGNTLFFTANESTHGYELWKTDGTTAGTVLVKDINPLGDSNISGGKSWTIGVAGNNIVFQANDGVHGREPWTSDGTAAGTFMIDDINPSGSSNPGSFQSFGNAIIFTTRDPDTDYYTMWEY